MIFTLTLPYRLTGADKIHTEGLIKFHSNIYFILFGGPHPLKISGSDRHLVLKFDTNVFLA